MVLRSSGAYCEADGCVYLVRIIQTEALNVLWFFSVFVPIEDEGIVVSGRLTAVCLTGNL